MHPLGDTSPVRRFLPAHYRDRRSEDQQKPVRLAGYTGVLVEAGATAVVEVACDARMFLSRDEAAQERKPLGGGEPIVARGLGDIRARLRMR